MDSNTPFSHAPHDPHSLMIGEDVLDLPDSVLLNGLNLVEGLFTV